MPFVFQVDNIILRANKMANNGKMGDYVINGRTKVHNISIDININHRYGPSRAPCQIDGPRQYFTQF